MSSLRRTELPDNEFQLGRVVQMNEAAKQLLARSHRVNLLALDAIVQSKRGNTSARGFDEVSSQMLGWSRDLLALLQQLRDASATVVNRTSAATKDERLLRILANAVELSQCSRVATRYDLLARELNTAVLALRRDWRQVEEVLADLEQLGMMACVLSRSAMIEACSASAELRDQLSGVSQEFNTHAQSVVDTISALVRATSKGKYR